jgi:hypothetical protein
MVASIDEIMQVVRSNPYIDGIGYFVEVTTENAVPADSVAEVTERMQNDFCVHSQATQEGDFVLGLDFHEHILADGEDGEYYLAAMEALLKHLEQEYGIDHLCMEFQFDLGRARKARRQVDELLQP